jgi:hypothetical protein
MNAMQTHIIFKVMLAIGKVSLPFPERLVLLIYVKTSIGPVHLLDKNVSSREDDYTCWPSSSGLAGRS